MQSLLEKFYSSGNPIPKNNIYSHQRNSINFQSSLNKKMVRHNPSLSNNLLNIDSKYDNYSRNNIYDSKFDKGNLKFNKVFAKNSEYDNDEIRNFINNQISHDYNNNHYINKNGIHNNNPIIKNFDEDHISYTDKRRKNIRSDYFETDWETQQSKHQYLKGLYLTPRVKRSKLFKGIKDPELIATLMNKNLEEFHSDFNKEISILLLKKKI